MEKEKLNKLIGSVLQSSKYKNVCTDFIKNIGAQQLSMHKNLKKAIKSTKNKLHQVGGAYFLKKVNYGKWSDCFNMIPVNEKEEKLRELCIKIMKYHSSTKERLPIIDNFYSRIFSILPSVNSIADIGCGLHPLAIPWMPLKKHTKYYAYDIYIDMIEFLNKLMHIINITGHAECIDVISSPPDIKVDLAFILKCIPCFDKIDETSGMNLIEKMNARNIVVSFPVKSISGKDKGMLRNYEEKFNKITKNKNWEIKRLQFDTELVFVISK